MELLIYKDRLKLEDKGSGELFAACPVDAYPGPAVEAVTDSSRYFVIRIMDDGGRSAFIGIGFSDRSDSFDLNVALQDHFKGVKKEVEIQKVFIFSHQTVLCTVHSRRTPHLNLS